MYKKTLEELLGSDTKEPHQSQKAEFKKKQQQKTGKQA